MEDHSRTIIHIDIDCFYAQVEMILNPSLQNRPVGIQQKNIVVTSNYVAREYGIEKCMLITEAKNLCPNLLLVNGEDLYKYRQISNKVTALLHSYSELVERLGLDENFIDVTNLVNEKLMSTSNTESTGFKFGENEMACDCGCTERISVGSQIAEEIRKQIYNDLKLTSCAGIAHNKLLAKIVGSKNKPNKQTLLFANNSTELMLSLESVNKIPWIGNVTAEQLSKINITTVRDLQDCSIIQLKNNFGFEKAENIKNLSLGIDNTPVKKTGKPQSIGLEDSSKPLTTEQEVKDKFRWLLQRLMVLIEEDGRIPKTVKVTVRKLDNTQPNISSKETRQCHINSSLKLEEKVMDVIMNLYRKVVLNKNFQITLLGISFANFEVKTNIKNTLTDFFSQNKEALIKHRADTTPGSSSKNVSKINSISSSKNTLPNDLLTDYDGVTTESELSCKSIMCPPNINEDVFSELPKDIQEELWNEHKRKNNRDITQRPCKKTKTNSILNYVVRQEKL